MDEDIDFRLAMAARLCQSAESMIAVDLRHGVQALDMVIKEMSVLARFSVDHPLRALRRLEALHAALSRVKSDRSADIVAHKAILVMWEVLNIVRQARRDIRSFAFYSTMQKKNHGVAYILATGLVVALIWAGGAWMKWDAASDIAYDLMRDDFPDISLVGIHGIEHNDAFSWRWIEGPIACMTVSMSLARKVTLRFSAMNPIPMQRLTITLNDRPVAAFEDLPAQPWGESTLQGRVELALQKGSNVLCFNCRDYNHNNTTFAPDDPTPYALALTSLTLTARP
ncbi:MAG: hypothetical protein HY795_08320 [Desulfovibrio sp.]|nr:hypothetical protein [Desulfovibrio sp.]MBI4960272.1 hypothetical protein [Desulfovibrio sp.]